MHSAGMISGFFIIALCCTKIKFGVLYSSFEFLFFNIVPEFLTGCVLLVLSFPPKLTSWAE